MTECSDLSPQEKYRRARALIEARMEGMEGIEEAKHAARVSHQFPATEDPDGGYPFTGPNQLRGYASYD